MIFPAICFTVCSIGFRFYGNCTKCITRRKRWWALPNTGCIRSRFYASVVGEGLFVGIVYGVWLFYAYDPVESAIFGINIYRFRNIVTLDFISHTHYKISYGPIVSRTLMSPHYHQLHHSALPEHWNKNFSVGLSCWDWLFGTLMAPKPNEDFIFGLRLTDRESEEYHTWWRLYTVPLVKISCMLMRQLNRAKSGRHRQLAVDGPANGTTVWKRVSTGVITQPSPRR